MGKNELGDIIANDNATSKYIDQKNQKKNNGTNKNY